MHIRELDRGKLACLGGAAVGAVVLPLVGRSLSAGDLNALQLTMFALMGGVIGVYLLKYILAGIRLVRAGRGRSLLAWACVSGVWGGGVFLLCQTLASGGEQGMWAWIVSGSSWHVFVRGSCFGALSGLCGAIQMAPAADHHGTPHSSMCRPSAPPRPGD